MTLDGRGIEADPARAADAFRTGCDDGWLEACDELGKLYVSGKGVKKSRVEAKKLFARACDGGIAGSCGELRSVSR